MNNLKKIASLLLALLIVLAMVPAAFAEAAPELGSITITGLSASTDGTSSIYEIYQMLELESYNKDTGVYSYKVLPAWEDFLNGEGAAYMTFDEQKYVTWVNASTDDATAAAFAKAALVYAKDVKKIAPTKSSATEGEFVVTTAESGAISGVFSNLPLGYYLVDSTVGALCGLSTTNPNAYINAKNGRPTVEKQVQEDLTGDWDETSTADIGQIVNYHTTISVHAGAQKYVLHDAMTDGLTFQSVSKVEHVLSNGTREDATLGEDYTVVTEGLTDDCDFEVRFTDAFCDHLSINDKVIVYYSAMLNRNAFIGKSDKEGNKNETYLEYGEDNYTTHDQTNTYTFSFDLVKTDGQYKLIEGAEFRIYDAAEGGNEVKVVLMEDGVTYRRARADEEGISIVVTGGKVTVVGLDNGDYYLEETVTPAGYNKLAARQQFTISDGNLNASIFQEENNQVAAPGAGVIVVNQSGQMLPETGGIGTTLFYVIGGALVAAAVVLLVTRKRMEER